MAYRGLDTVHHSAQLVVQETIDTCSDSLPPQAIQIVSLGGIVAQAPLQTANFRTALFPSTSRLARHLVHMQYGIEDDMPQPNVQAGQVLALSQWHYLCFPAAAEVCRKKPRYPEATHSLAKSRSVHVVATLVHLVLAETQMLLGHIAMRALASGSLDRAVIQEHVLRLALPLGAEVNVAELLLMLPVFQECPTSTTQWACHLLFP